MRLCRCCWSPPCQSAPSGQTEVVSLTRCPPRRGRVGQQAGLYVSHCWNNVHLELINQSYCSLAPFHQSEWPCPGGRTWSGQPEFAAHPRWQWHHSPCGWRWRSTLDNMTEHKTQMGQYTQVRVSATDQMRTVRRDAAEMVFHIRKVKNGFMWVEQVMHIIFKLL